jgi:hypothetical protein
VRTAETQKRRRKSAIIAPWSWPPCAWCSRVRRLLRKRAAMVMVVVRVVVHAHGHGRLPSDHAEEDHVDLRERLPLPIIEARVELL